MKNEEINGTEQLEGRKRELVYTAEGANTKQNEKPQRSKKGTQWGRHETHERVPGEAARGTDGEGGVIGGRKGKRRSPTSPRSARKPSGEHTYE